MKIQTNGKGNPSIPVYNMTCFRLPTVTVYTRNQYKALIDSGATVIHLRTTHGSPMSFMEKATLHLQIANFKFSHTFIICDRLLETDFLFGINLQKQYSLLYCSDLDRYLFIQREGLFLTFTRNREDLFNVPVVKSTWKIPLDTIELYQLGSRDTI